MRTLRDERETLIAQVERLSEQLSKQDATISIQKEYIEAAETEKEKLSHQNSKLLVSNNPQAKTQYLDSVR